VRSGGRRQFAGDSPSDDKGKLKRFENTIRALAGGGGGGGGGGFGGGGGGGFGFQ